MKVQGKSSASARIRWLEATPEERNKHRQAISQGMRAFWESKTPEEKRAIAIKREQTRRANRKAKLNGTA